MHALLFAIALSLALDSSAVGDDSTEGTSDDVQVETISDHGSGENVSELGPDTPLPLALEGHGTIMLDAYPRSSELSVNGFSVGVGHTRLEGVKAGMYQVSARHSRDSASELVYVMPGQTVRKRLVLEREGWFVITTSFSQCMSHQLLTFGPSLDLGVRYKQFYYGINFNWDIGELNEVGHAEMLGGAGCQFFWEGLNYEDALVLAPGACLGFWLFDGGVYSSSRDDYGASYTEPFFGGISVKGLMGVKYVHLAVKYSLLIGRHVGSLLHAGIEATM